MKMIEMSNGRVLDIIDNCTGAMQTKAIRVARGVREKQDIYIQLDTDDKNVILALLNVVVNSLSGKYDEHGKIVEGFKEDKEIAPRVVLTDNRTNMREFLQRAERNLQNSYEVLRNEV